MKCSFCSKEYPLGTGVTFYKKDGTSIHYCSRRCEKYTEQKRNPRKLKWTGRFEKGKAEAKKKA
ncbi:50S ribosomal protein L24e [Candidatus Micrarchaeota archaeon]|nr:50S ribosomal protein L24e [Candidatus Micrarchaeota archaeon]